MTENKTINVLNAHWNFLKNNWRPCDVNVLEALSEAIFNMQKIQEYRALGTVEELKEAMEKQRAKKPKLYGDFEDGKLLCPNCEEDLMDLIDCGFNNCPYCGNKIDWSEEE